MSLEVQGLQRRPGRWPVEGVAEEDWCRHTGGTGTVDTVGIVAFAGSTPCKIWSAEATKLAKKAP